MNYTKNILKEIGIFIVVSFSLLCHSLFSRQTQWELKPELCEL